MTTLNLELFDALLEGGVSREKATAAAAYSTTLELRIAKLEMKINFLYVFIAGSQALLGAWLKYGGGV